MTLKAQSILKRKAEEGEKLAKPKNVRFKAWVLAKTIEKDAEMSDAPTTFNTLWSQSQSKVFWAEKVTKLKKEAKIKKTAKEANEKAQQHKIKAKQPRPAEIRPAE